MEKDISAIQRAIFDIREKKFLQKVEVAFTCSNGGISTIGIEESGKGFSSPQRCDGEKEDKVDRIFELHNKMINHVKKTRFSGILTLTIYCKHGVIYNGAITQEHTNLFHKDFDPELRMLCLD